MLREEDLEQPLRRAGGADAPGSASAWATVAPAMDEATLWSKLRKIEALHAGTTSDVEREASRLAPPPARRCSWSSCCTAWGTRRSRGWAAGCPTRAPGAP